MYRITLLGLFLIFWSESLLGQNQGELSSPDGLLKFEWQVDNNNGSLAYQVKYKEEVVIQPSNLGILLQNTSGWIDHLKIMEVMRSSKDTAWRPVYGEKEIIPDHYNQVILPIVRGPEQFAYLHLIVRAYDEGIAFRYHFPESGRTSTLEIRGEETRFVLPAGSMAWHTPRPQGSYRLVPLANWEQAAEMPLTLELPGGLYASILEAEVVNYAVSKINTCSESGGLCLSMKSPVTVSSPFSTPWRVVMVADRPGNLLENNHIVLNLNPPSQIENPWWIMPGKVIREITLSTQGAKACVDFAVAHNLQYIHFDAGWYGHEYTVSSDATTVDVDPDRNPNQDLDLFEAIRYAKSKGIKVFVYVNRRALERQLDEILPLYKKWGIDGIKYGFVQTGSHRWSVWLHEAIKKAADYQLMVNVHDRYRPTGFSRTYPNLMTMEGIRGNEEMPDATHNTILPFTRFVGGKADYTVCYYYRREFGHENRHINTTPAHQLAISVIYYSPLQYLFWYDRPGDYQGEPEIEFFENVHTVWDETRVLNGQAGQFATVARRKEKDWFVGTITNNAAREMHVPLDFLAADKIYLANIYTDGGAAVKTRTHVKIDRFLLKAQNSIELSLQASGGAAIHLKEASVEDQKRYKWLTP